MLAARLWPGSYSCGCRLLLYGPCRRWSAGRVSTGGRCWDRVGRHGALRSGQNPASTVVRRRQTNVTTSLSGKRVIRSDFRILGNELQRAVRTRPLMSVDVAGGCYSVGYSPPGLRPEVPDPNLQDLLDYSISEQPRLKCATRGLPRLERGSHRPIRSRAFPCHRRVRGHRLRLLGCRRRREVLGQAGSRVE